ncbi:L-serine ammonia-lyase [Saccharopolyspora sp. NPDC049357]|uniref:L-serine ammonia-lyase n=1 Tax=Saccharopolyspora sp. NPDC049357 TaxID=3154507 RepID=UPI00342305EE
MSISAFDLFSVGIGPSSSHTNGPMIAARRFVVELDETGLLAGVRSVRVELFGSLGATGRGHGSDKAVLLGLLGEHPGTVDPDVVDGQVRRIHDSGRIELLGARGIDFDPGSDLVLHRDRSLPGHPNGLVFTAWTEDGVTERTFYSIGGGFVVADGESPAQDAEVLPHPFATADELIGWCHRTGSSISDVVLANETARRPETEVRQGLLEIWAAMRDCVRRGCERDGELPGALRVPRRAARLRTRLDQGDGSADPLGVQDWVSLYALAVNEENAAGGRVVTAPTNGAAGIIPAVLHYYVRFVPGADEDGVIRFLLTAAAVGSLCKQAASISGAEVGCQGEVGSACSMAAAGLAEVLAGTPEQVENAAEIGMEHHLGLTCDPVGGLVQIPCIERNAVAANTAITAARIALNGEGTHVVSLDTVLKTMRETGADMSHRYKETALGGLALNVVAC